MLRWGAMVSVVSVVLLASFVAQAQVNVTQHHNHLSRDGLYIDPAFTPANVAGLVRDSAFDGSITGNVYAQPLYIEGGPRGRAVVIAVTQSNNVFALDAFSGKVVWWTNVAPSVPSGLSCGNVTPYGITGTPVVDLPTRSLFFDAITKYPGSNIIKHLIYSLNVDTGGLNPGWPVVMYTNVFIGTNRFNALAEGERGALTVIGTNLYVPYGGLWGDCSPYNGGIVGIPISNPTNLMSWATWANGGGAWSVGGVASDGTDPFLATGNTFNPSAWSGGEAILHLTPGLGLTNANTNSYWVPTNWSTLDMQDNDLGGSGPVLLDVPGATPSKLLMALGKDGNAYLLNRTNLGGISAPVASLHVAGSSIIQAAAAYRTTVGSYVVFANANNLNALFIIASNPPAISNAWSRAENGSGSPFVTSTDGTNNVIVWGIGSENDQRLHAFLADSGTNVYAGGGANELMAGTRRFNTAIVARGRIYVANDNKVYAFTLPGQTVAPMLLNNLSAQRGIAFQFSFTNIPNALFNVFSSTNVTAPFTNWTWLGSAPEVSPGHYQFTNALDTGTSPCFYRVSSP